MSSLLAYRARKLLRRNGFRARSVRCLLGMLIAKGRWIGTKPREPPTEKESEGKGPGIEWPPIAEWGKAGHLPSLWWSGPEVVPSSGLGVVDNGIVWSSIPFDSASTLSVMLSPLTSLTASLTILSAVEWTSIEVPPRWIELSILSFMSNKE